MWMIINIGVCGVYVCSGGKPRVGNGFIRGGFLVYSSGLSNDFFLVLHYIKGRTVLLVGADMAPKP